MRRQQSGFSLVELMISLALSLIVMSAGVFMFGEISKSSMYEIRSARSLDQARDVMQLIARDMRRAGYQGHLSRLEDPDGLNIFDADKDEVAAATGVAVTEHTYVTAKDLDGDGENECITYAYNRDDSWDGADDGTANDVIDADEYFGFKLDDNAVWMLTDASAGTAFGCDEAGATWLPITHDQVLSVSRLAFQIVGDDPANPAASDPTRRVIINLEGTSRTTAGEQSAFALEQSVDLPNLRLFDGV